MAGPICSTAQNYNCYTFYKVNGVYVWCWTTNTANIIYRQDTCNLSPVHADPELCQYVTKDCEALIFVN